jgi:hypothetical protein
MPRGKSNSRGRKSSSSGGNKRGRKGQQDQGFFHEIGRSGGQERGRNE